MACYLINVLATQDLNEIADYFSTNNVRAGEMFGSSGFEGISKTNEKGRLII
jgi:hypothetical protein